MILQSDKPKKILIFSLAYFPYVGGAEVSIDEITKRVPPQDISFSLICARYNSNTPRVERIGNVTVYRVGWGKYNPSPEDLTRFPYYLFSKVLYPPLSALKAIQLQRKEKFCAWWVVLSYAGFGTVLARILGVRVPYILTLQEGDTEEVMLGRKRIRPVLFLLKKVFRQASVVHSISRSLGEWARRMGHAHDVVYIPNGVSIKHFQETSEEAVQTAKEKLGKIEGQIWLVTTSRLVEKNGIDTVIRALKHLPEKVQFAVLGEGPEYTNLCTLARECAVETRVHFLGLISQKDLPAFYHASDIFIRPSRSEGQGISFIEAMASGLPVIATQVGGIADFLFDPIHNPEHSPTGFAVLVDAPEEIASRVQYIIENPEKTQEVVKNAQAMVLEKYDWDMIAAQMREEVFSPFLKRDTDV